ncbi:MAG TPA: hypothetical protein VFU23_05745, partial [Gemmatimonadales bacterium]|nr:hypothetical protein [Gemmatimonadales bacterium]
PSAPAVKANGDPANLVQVITLSTNTAQVRKLANNLFVPAFFNGPNLFSAKLFITGNSTPVPSTNVIPVVLINQDALLSAPAFTMAPASTTPSASGTLSSGGATWYKGNVIFNGGNFVSFFPVSPASASWTATGGCSASANSASGTPQTGITFSGTLTCGSTVEGLVGLGTLTLTPGTAPAADVIDVPYAGYSQVGTAYVVAGENRYNLLAGGVAPSPTGVFIDNKAPTIVPNEIGFVAGCFVGNLTFPVPGCWINGSYNLAGDFPATDAGSGVASVNTFSYTPSPPPLVCTSSSLTPASAAEDISPTKYNACAVATDNLGNSSTAFGTNAFGVDKTNPTITYAKDPAVVPALYAPPHTLAEAVPVMALDWKVNDNNSGLDTATALVVTNSHTTNGACSISVNAALNAEPAPGADRFMIPANVPAPDGGCGTPGYYHWGANVTDRAGNNTADPVDHDFGFEPGVPTILALAPFPLYGGGTTTTVTVFASHTGASLSAAKMGIWYTSNAAGPVATPVELIFDQGQIFNAPWATPLFLATPSAGTPLSVAAASSLAGIVIDSTQPPVSAFDSLSAVVRDVFDASNLTGALVHADTAVLVIPAPFIDPEKVSTDASVWANPKIGAATFSGSGACSFTYATPSNGPTIPSSVIVVRTVLANIYDVLFPITASPTLVSDNGTTRIYSYSVSGSTCASFGGTLKLIAVKNDGAGLPVGYLVP